MANGEVSSSQRTASIAYEEMLDQDGAIIQQHLCAANEREQEDARKGVKDEAADELDGTHGHSDTPVGFSLG